MIWKSRFIIIIYWYIDWILFWFLCKQEIYHFTDTAVKGLEAICKFLKRRLLASSVLLIKKEGYISEEYLCICWFKMKKHQQLMKHMMSIKRQFPRLTRQSSSKSLPGEGIADEDGFSLEEYSTYKVSKLSICSCKICLYHYGWYWNSPPWDVNLIW